MGTHALISKVNNDGSVDSIYCHNDGYLDWDGQILNDHYQDAVKVNEMFELGGIRHLGKYLETCPELVKYGTDAIDNDFYVDVDYRIDYTLTYKRNGGIDLPATHYENLDEYLKVIKNIVDVGYYYIFKNNKWYFTRGGKTLRLLKTILKNKQNKVA